MSDSEFIYDASNEALIIGAAIADSSARKKLVRKLAADEFLVPKHSVIWQAIRALSDKGLDYTPEAMERLLLDAGGDSAVREYLEAIESQAVVPANLDWHTETMAWDATRARTLKGPIPEMLQLMNDPKADRADVITTARATLKALDGGGRRYMRRPAELYRQYRAEIAARRSRRNIYPLGAEPFDRNLSEGFMPGRTSVTAGLPGSGKSTLWVAFAILLAKAGRKVVYCAWEMEPDSLLDVGAAHMTGIPLVKIIQGTMNEEEAHRVDCSVKWILKRITFMENPFIRGKANDGKKPSNDRNLDILEGYLAESGADVAVYDLWERMLPWRKPDDVAGALYRMQEIHKEYRIHGAILHQLTLKDVEKRTDKRPTRDAIKGTGGYVEVPDLIIGIHRDAQFKAVEDNRIETICLKQRKGRANWAVRWEWDGATCRIRDPEEVPYDPGLESVDAGDIGRTVRDVKAIKSGRKRQEIGRRQ